ncbi:MerC domain-containing protein [uncultured Massilia sp.]|uniref:MerC domain-containing protein n=1 Tax=uncultured Massilia sp. TaxID=169973 RepID=UPI0025FF9A00|nr:MerC domain-containing protein [uncultured Massilia sp.]
MNKLPGVGDAAGLLASTLCLLHCLALPLLLALFPALGWTGGHHHGFHEAMVGVALLAAAIGLGPGFLAHRRRAVPLLGGAGLACLALAVFAVGPRWGHAAETALSVTGALLLCAAHWRNRVCCRHCAAAH